MICLWETKSINLLSPLAFDAGRIVLQLQQNPSILEATIFRIETPDNTSQNLP